MKIATIFEEYTSVKDMMIRTGEFGKRTFDIIFSVIGLLILSPIFAIVAIYIKQTSPGPVFYRGPRVGRWGRIFNILKFRTMYEHPDSYDGPRITASDDERITPSGRWLRDTKLNELPQLWNVLKGEMSLVGPRPEDPQVAETWQENVRAEILSVRPGITSPASVFFRDEENKLQAESVMEKYLNVILPSKIRLDQIYVRNHTFLGDIDVLFLTAIFLLPNLRQQPIPEHMLIWGPVSRLMSRHLNWLLIDIPVAFLAMLVATYIWRLVGPLNLGIGKAAIVAIGIAILFGLFNAILGMNRIVWSFARPSDALGLVVSDLIVITMLVGARLLWPISFPFPVGMLILASILAFFGFLSSRYRLRLITGLATRWLRWRGAASQLGESVLIIGAGAMAQITLHLLHRDGLGKAFTIIGMIDDDPKKQGLSIDGYKILGTTQDLQRIIREKNIGVILFSIGKIQPDRRQNILDLCYKTGVRLVLIPNILDLISACLFAPQTLIDSKDISPEWDGTVPVQVIMGWLTELEALAHPGNAPLIARLRQLRDALAIDVIGKNP